MARSRHIQFGDQYTITCTKTVFMLLSRKLKFKTVSDDEYTQYKINPDERDPETHYYVMNSHYLS